MDNVPWNESFKVDDQDGGPIRLNQVGRKTFAFGSSIEYQGARTGLEDKLDDKTLAQIRRITPDELPTTDLASVPGPFRWFAGRYGAHTPAALIHDRYIGADDTPDGLTDQYVDRYFRFMMADTGVRWLKRWIIWSAVAMRTRFEAGGLKRWSFLLWVALAIAGTVSFAVGVATANWALAIWAALAPIPACLLWERQYGAGLVAAYSSPWIVPPTVLAVVAYLVYLLIEWVASWALSEDVAGTDTYRPDEILS